jgi:hypothetical protein
VVLELGSERLGRPGAERGFPMEGIFEPSLMQKPPRSGYASEGACVVAGEGFEPPTSGL